MGAVNLLPALEAHTVGCSKLIDAQRWPPRPSRPVDPPTIALGGHSHLQCGSRSAAATIMGAAVVAWTHERIRHEGRGADDWQAKPVDSRCHVAATAVVF
eukprot:CAMPEP_0181195298 /NCGR_PEP_ID=MMETSP1096-20121128/14809_1 /TAXON_ID=156174 ORGANISM="Chrysochromulina ericina, Strain CCMP281" /NCGR_SAMPLE_ID=MMETSP1096 /ASSEMBLY_ACC=CAM_ASM_000453 /LENGTH=99 /DNA_ID=CAMNT_0023284885 /DNA_START=398 /DNA_END=697 /DNA_ORIENTATION=+